MGIIETLKRFYHELLAIAVFAFIMALIYIGFCPSLAYGATVSVTWSANTEPDLGGYTVYYATYSMLSMTPAQANATVSVTKVSVPGNALGTAIGSLNGGSWYYFLLTARNNAVPTEESGFGVQGDLVTILELSTFTPVGQPGVPLPPTNPAVVADSATQFTVSWTDASSDETGFKVEASAGESGPFSAAGTATAGATSFTINSPGFVPGDTYYFRVKAANGAGDSAPTAVVSAQAAAPVPPAAASNLTATGVSSTQINLTWTDNSNNEAGFKVERSVAGASGPFTLVVTQGVNANSFSDVDLAPSTVYFYRVTATNSAGNAAFDEDSATTPAAPNALGLSDSAPAEVNVSVADVVIRTRVSSQDGTPISQVTLAYARPGEAGFPSSMPMTLLGGTSDTYEVILSTDVIGMRAGELRIRVTARDAGTAQTTGQERVVQLRSVVDVPPGAAGVVDLPHRLGSQWGTTKADFSLLPPAQRPKKVKIGQEDVRRRAPAVRESAINRALNGGRAGMIYDFQADGKAGSVFSRPVKLTLAYLDADAIQGIVDGTDIPAGDLKVFHFDGYEWRLVGGTVNTADHTVTAMTNHFSLYGLFARAPGGAGIGAKAAEAFLTPASLDGFGDVATFGLNAKEVHIYDVTGREVFGAQGDGSNAIVWSARDDGGKPVESGSYVAKVISLSDETAYQTLVVAK